MRLYRKVPLLAGLFKRLCGKTNLPLQPLNNYNMKGKEMAKDAIDFKDTNVSTLYRKLLIPTLLGTLSMSAMTTIDGIFVGHGVGSDGVAAVNIVAPVYQVFSGIGLMLGAGCSVVVSILMARGKMKAARMNVTQALLFSTLLTAAVCVPAMLFPERFARLLGSSETLLPMVSDYLFWIMPSYIFQMWSFIGLFLIRLDGAPKVAMWCNVVAALMNIVLDWVMIFPLGWGVKGAAIATSVSIMAGGIIALAYLLFYARMLKPALPKWSRKSLCLSLRNVGYHCRVGSPSLLGEMTLAVLIFMGNLMFMKYLGDDGVAAFGIACYYTPFFFNIGNAMAQSAQPIISYNYGAKDPERVKAAFKKLLKTSLIYSVSLWILVMAFPRMFAAMFTTEESLLAFTETALRVYLGCMFMFGIQMACQMTFNALGNAKASIVVAITRKFVLLLPLIYIMPMLFSGDKTMSVYMAEPVADFIAVSFTAVLFSFQFRKTVRKIETI